MAGWIWRINTIVIIVFSNLYMVCKSFSNDFDHGKYKQNTIHKLEVIFIVSTIICYSSPCEFPCYVLQMKRIHTHITYVADTKMVKQKKSLGIELFIVLSLRPKIKRQKTVD